MSDLGAARGRIVIDTSDVERAVNEVKRGSQAMTTALNAIGVGVGITAVKRLAEITFELAENAAQANATRDAFNTLASSFGQNADDMLAAMRTASKGMISDANLVLDANRAMMLGVASNAEQMSQLLDVARVRGRAMGLSISESFDKLVTGLGRISPKILDDLGIKGTQKALDDYAASVDTTADALSDAQKQAILFNAVMASTQPLIDAAAKSGDSAADKFEQFGAKLDNTKQKMGDLLLAAGATDTLDTFSQAIDDTLTQLGLMAEWFGKIKTELDSFGEITGIQKVLDQINEIIEKWQTVEGHFGYLLGLRQTDPGSIRPQGMGGMGGGGGSGGFGGGGGSSGPIPVPASEVNAAAVLSAQKDFYKGLGDITRNSNRDIQRATEDAGRQRAETVRSYELGIAREEEDFLRNRARQQRDYESSILQLMRDAQARDSKIQTDLGEQIGDAQKDSNKHLAEQEADFQKSRQRAQRDYGNNLLDAAGDLDAKRVYQLQRDNAARQKDAQEDQEDAVKKERESLTERIAQAQDAAQKQLDEARAADAQRLEDMRAAMIQQRADEDEDRTTRQARAAEDQTHALEQQDAEAGRRILQIQDNAADERDALLTAFEDQLKQAGLFNAAYKTKQDELQKQILKDLAPFMKSWYDTNVAAMNSAIQGPRPQWPSLSGLPLTMNTLPASGNHTSNSRTFNPVVNLTITGGSSLTESQLETAIHDALLKVFEETN